MNQIKKIYLDMDDVLVDIRATLALRIKEIIQDTRYSGREIETFRRYRKDVNVDHLAIQLHRTFVSKDLRQLSDYEEALINISYLPIRNNISFWAALPLFPYSMDLVNYCISLVGRENVYFLTSPLDKECIQGKKIWVAKYFPDFANRTIYNSDKYLWANQNSLLIDDRPKNINLWKQHNGHGILHQNYSKSLFEIKDFFNSNSSVSNQLSNIL